MKIILTLLLLLTLAGCGWGGESPETTVLLGLDGQPVTGPRLVFSGTEITYNGQPLRLGDTLEDWERVLGKADRTSHPMGGVYIWDDLGIRGYTRNSDKRRMKTLSVELNRNPQHAANDLYSKPGEGISPSSLFNGYLEIDGAPLRRDSIVREYGGKFKNILSFNCRSGISLCSTSIRQGDIYMYVYISIDERKRNSIIYTLSFSDDTN
ncbi:MAG: hypothetical protein LBV45_05630 [Xanthomonadaceae bacterium]|jgi:hypothetical protein|nr:hypothetical protein [Xanthomonadaceae bacterium]